MKTIILLTFVSFTVYAQPKQALRPDFRSVFWGDSIEKVLKSESAKPDSVAADFVRYDTVQLGKHKAKLAYAFDGKGLVHASYIIYLDGVDMTHRAIIYEDTQAALSEKYGPKQTNYKEKSVAQAYVLSQEYHFSTFWKTPKTKVELMMVNEMKTRKEDIYNFIGILYTGVVAEKKRDALEKKEETAKKKRLLKDL